MRRAALAAVGLVAATSMVPSHAAAPAPARIVTLSNRADLVSGNDALIGVTVPAGSSLRSLAIGRRDVTRLLEHVSAQHWVGLVDKLAVGRNVLTARTSSGAPSRLVVTNHPSTGPVLAGPQVQPWVCDTASHGLGPARNKACTTPAMTSWVYKQVGTAFFKAYHPDNPPPAASVATTTTDQGRTVPYVVRVEKGVMDRGLYTIAVLADPRNRLSATHPDPAWNHKLASPFGGSCNPRHVQEPVDTGSNALSPTLFEVLDDAKLSRGFMVAHNNLGNLGSDCNDVVAAESLLMLKEHIGDRYGAIRYTIGYGCSGGSMLQHLLAANYPGLLDGITPACSFPDVWSTVTESEDCHLLDRFFDANPGWTPTQQAAVTGYQTPVSCVAFDKLPINSTQSWLDPSHADGCGVTAYPHGPRCTIQDYQVAQLGRRADGRANRPFDNTGVVYGLQAYRAGIISAEQLVSLNEGVGGDDIDWHATPARSSADLAGVRNAYLGGRITTGAGLAQVPIIDLRGTSNQEIHTDYHSYVLRARLDRDNGTHANQVIWTSEPLTVDPTSYAQSFVVMDHWLAAIEKDHRPISKARKVALDRPAPAVDSCWVAGQQVVDDQLCTAAFPHYGDPRLASSGPATNDVLACSLRPVPATPGLTRALRARLVAVFPQGVCDPTRPGRGQVRALPWATYASGAPVALGLPPTSS
jgi:hypothetical protein